MISLTLRHPVPKCPENAPRIYGTLVPEFVPGMSGNQARNGAGPRVRKSVAKCARRQARVVARRSRAQDKRTRLSQSAPAGRLGSKSPGSEGVPGAVIARGDGSVQAAAALQEEIEWPAIPAPTLCAPRMRRALGLE